MKLIVLVIVAFSMLHSCRKEYSPTNGEMDATEFQRKNKKKGEEQTFKDWYKLNSHRLDKVSREEILDFQNSLTRKQIFNSLTPRAKAKVWQDKLNEFMVKYSLTSNQKNFVTKFGSYINDELWEKQIDQPLHNELNSLRNEGAFEFGNGEILRVLMADIDNDIDFVGIAFNPWIVHVPCECNMKSDWCGFPSNDGSSCSAVDGCGSRGCGTFWVYDCNGNCRMTM